MTHLWAALLLVLACRAAGAVSTEGWPLTPEDSRRIGVEHARTIERLTATMDRIEALRKAYKGAADLDAAFYAWGQGWASAHAELEALERLTNDHKDRYHATEVRLITRAMTKAVGGEAMPNRVIPELSELARRNDEIQTSDTKVHYRFWEEGAFYRDAEDARSRQRDRDARDKATFKGAAAVVAVLLTVLVLVARRYARPADVTVISEPAGAPALLKAQTVPAVIGGNIEVVRPIGRGGMGEVYEGLDRTLQRRVALKRLRSELTGSPNDLSRLLAEARLVAALKHDNIVAIHSVEKEAGQVFLVFEYVDGPTLAARIAQSRQIAWPEALRIFSGACAALGAAHAKDIVHRDLKPGNIMLDSKGVVKVMDFGIAHQAAQAVSRLTRSGAWGTPPYMSPEQELGEVNKGVDLFALNVCLYEMLTGELPFTGPNFLAQKREKVYVPVTQAVPALPKALDAFFATAFDPDPAKRFQDAPTLAAAANAIA